MRWGVATIAIASPYLSQRCTLIITNDELCLVSPPPSFILKILGHWCRSSWQEHSATLDKSVAGLLWRMFCWLVVYCGAPSAPYAMQRRRRRRRPWPPLPDSQLRSCPAAWVSSSIPPHHKCAIIFSTLLALSYSSMQPHQYIYASENVNIFSGWKGIYVLYVVQVLRPHYGTIFSYLRKAVIRLCVERLES